MPVQRHAVRNTLTGAASLPLLFKSRFVRQRGHPSASFFLKARKKSRASVRSWSPPRTCDAHSAGPSAWFHCRACGVVPACVVEARGAQSIRHRDHPSRWRRLGGLPTGNQKVDPCLRLSGSSTRAACTRRRPPRRTSPSAPAPSRPCQSGATQYGRPAGVSSAGSAAAAGSRRRPCTA